MTPSVTNFRRLFGNGFLEAPWRWVVFLTIYFVSQISGLFLPTLFGAPFRSPGSDPPWYFIRQDFFQGAGSLAGIIAMLAILAATWRHYRFSNWMLVVMVCIWMVPSVVTSMVIYWRCADFFHFSQAVAYWPTFDSYSGSGVKFVGIPVGLVLALLIGALMWRRRSGERHNVA